MSIITKENKIMIRTHLLILNVLAIILIPLNSYALDNKEDIEKEDANIYKYEGKSKNITPFIFKEGSFNREFLWFKLQRGPYFSYTEDFLNKDSNEVINWYKKANLIILRVSSDIIRIKNDKNETLAIYFLNKDNKVVGYVLLKVLAIDDMLKKDKDLLKPILEFKDESKYLNNLAAIPNNVQCKLFKKSKKDYTQTFCLVGKKSKEFSYLAWEGFYPSKYEDKVKYYLETEKNFFQDLLNDLSDTFNHYQ